MNQTNEVTPQSTITEQRAKVEQELRLAKEYWLRTVQPHIAGRILRGVEFFAAQHAHWLLQEAIKQAGDWNHSCDLKKDEAHFPLPPLHRLDGSVKNKRFLVAGNSPQSRLPRATLR
jgi:hypothetical protein